MKIDKKLVEAKGFDFCVDIVKMKILKLAFDNNDSIRNNAIRLKMNRDTLRMLAKKHNLDWKNKK